MRRRTEAQNVNGRYINCPHYQGTLSDAYREPAFTCKKRGERINCLGCNTCPKCGGIMYCEHRSISHGQYHIVLVKEMKCLACGLYATEQASVPKDRPMPRKQARAGAGQTPPPLCSVKGCQHRTWDGLKVKLETPNGIQAFDVCDSHFRRMKTWRSHKNKGLGEIPIIYFMGELIDNPEYEYKFHKKGK